MPSRILGRGVSYGVARPPNQRFPGRGLPLVVVLPGRGCGPREMLAANDVYARVDRLAHLNAPAGGASVRIDCGEWDPFRAATAAFIAALTFKPGGGFAPGDHDDAYWRKVASAEIEFLWRSLLSRFGGS